MGGRCPSLGPGYPPASQPPANQSMGHLGPQHLPFSYSGFRRLPTRLSASVAPKLEHGFQSADENRIPPRPVLPYCTSKCQYPHTLILACECETGARQPSRWTRRSFTNGARSRGSTRAPAEVLLVCVTLSLDVLCVEALCVPSTCIKTCVRSEKK